MTTQNFQNFESKFDEITRSIARNVNSFFKGKKNYLEPSSVLENELIIHLQTNISLQLTELKVEIKNIQGGYSGYIKTTLLKQSLFFEIYF